MQAETRGIMVLPSGYVVRPWDHPDAARSFGREVGVAVGLILAFVAVMVVLVATSSPAPAGLDAQRSIVPGATQPVADPHGVRPSLLRTAP